MQFVNSRRNSARNELSRQEDERVKRLAELDEEERYERARLANILREIEEEFSRRRARIQAQMRELRARWNETLLILHLPAEILALIFEEYVRTHWEEYIQTSRSRRRTSIRPYSWFTLLHVCRHWRQIACLVPNLWTYIVPTYLPCTQFVLSHSGRMPLTVHSRPKTFPKLAAYMSANQAYETVLQELPRMRWAQLWIDDSHSQYLLELEKRQSGIRMPLMQNLTLSFAYDRGVHVGPLSRDSLASLTSLVLRNARLEIMKPLMRATLTSLDVDLEKVHTADMIATLEQLPILQRLSVASLEAHYDGRDFEERLLLPKDTSVHLRCLKSLRIKSESLCIGQFLNSVLFPLDATIRVEFTDMVISRFREADIIFPLVISKALKSDGALTDALAPRLYLSALHLGQTEEQECMIAYLRTSETPGRTMDDSFLHNAEGARLQVKFPPTSRCYFDKAGLRGFVSSIPELPAMSLELVTTADTYVYAFQGNLLNLERLHVSREVVVENMLSALTAALPAESHLPDEGGQLGGMTYHTEQDTRNSFVHELVACMRTRAAHGYKIKKIGLTAVDNLSPGDRAILDEYAVEALVDVVEMPESLDSVFDGEEESDWDYEDDY
ncbi:hypothetical protein NM688_g7550 [Phlebia brevispora]|uniref:Uncharacterized protein n=1 Tax=Phlebia brevispora TaxID=194682 RepID=A0ACC1S476_9APHY|nr:hypothetical protein NM688_g7550 [Phlebia brevispora]